MADRETVITHLQIIHTWAEFARERDLQFFTSKHLEDIAQWSDDAIALLKEQNSCENCAIAIEDRQPIVRCENCDNKECWGRAGDVVCGIDGTPHRPDWFCADGERKNRNDTINDRSDENA